MTIALKGSAAPTLHVPRGQNAARYGRAVAARVTATPATTGIVVALAAICALVVAGPLDADELSRWASTNIVNLHTHPISAMIVSAFVLTGPSVVNIAFTAIACGLLERKVGARRMLAAAAAGQVIPSLLTEGAVRLAIHTGQESWSAAWRFDVGISYVMFATAAAATRFAPRRARRIALAIGLVVTLAQLAGYHDMTSSGHALAYAIGLLCWPLLARDEKRPRRRAHAMQVMAAMTVVGLLAIYLPLSVFGLHHDHAHHVRTASASVVTVHSP